MQDLERDGFNAYLISVDRTDAPYQYLKQCMYEGRIQVSQSKLLQREMRELVYQDGKVDHPQTTKADSLTYGKGSKDCADALAGSIYAMTDDLESFTFISKTYNRQSYLKHMKLQTIIKKETIVKDMKKMLKDGGMDRFIKKERERKEILNVMQGARLVTSREDRKFKSSLITFDKIQ